MKGNIAGSRYFDVTSCKQTQQPSIGIVPLDFATSGEVCILSAGLSGASSSSNSGTSPQEHAAARD